MQFVKVSLINHLRPRISFIDKSEISRSEIIKLITIIIIMTGAFILASIQNSSQVLKQESYNSKVVCDSQCKQEMRYTWQYIKQTTFQNEIISNTTSAELGNIITVRRHQYFIDGQIAEFYNGVYRWSVPLLNIVPGGCQNSIIALRYNLTSDIITINMDASWIGNNDCGFMLTNNAEFSTLGDKVRSMNVTGLCSISNFQQFGGIYNSISCFNRFYIYSMYQTPITMSIINITMDAKDIDITVGRYENAFSGSTITSLGKEISLIITGLGIEGFRIRIIREQTHFDYVRTSLQSRSVSDSLQIYFTTIVSAISVISYLIRLDDTVRVYGDPTSLGVSSISLMTKQ